MNTMKKMIDRRKTHTTNQKEKFLAITFAITMMGMNMYAEDISAREIMQKAHDRETGNSSVMTVTMELVSKSGAKRSREIIVYSKDYGTTGKSVMSFRTPKDVAGVGYLTWEYDETGKDDDMWLYLPAMKKVRRIAGSSRNNDFMGTDFTYDDMGSRDLDKDDYTLDGSEMVDGFDCWRIIAMVKDKKEPFIKRILRVRKDNWVIAKAEYFDRQDKLTRVLTVPSILLIDGIWTAKQMKMENVRDGHYTTIDFEDILYNIPVEDAFFTVNAIERGIVK